MTEFYILNITDLVNPEVWKLYNEDRRYISRDDVNIHLKLDSRIEDDKIDFSDKDLITINASSMIVNDYKNMNPIVMFTNDNIDHHYLILTIGPEFELLRYKWVQDLEILGSFSSKDGKQIGCIASINPEDFSDICVLKLYNRHYKKIYSVTVQMSDRTHKPCWSREEVTNVKDIKALGNVRKKYKRSLHFKFVVKKPITKVYITTDDKLDELCEFLNEKYPHIRPVVYTVPDPETSTNEELVDCLRSIRDYRIRAITEYGVKIPYDVICELKVLYIFMMELTEDIIKMTCIKAN